MNKSEMKRTDGWVNVITGLGMKGRDKSTAGIPIPHHLSQQEIDDLYRADDIAQKIVDRIPDEFFRAGYEILVKGDDDSALELRNYMNRLQADRLFKRACKLARLYGGAAIILGIDDGLLSSEPVNMENIKSVRWATVLDRWQLTASEIETDISSPDYGLPTVYELHSRHVQQENIRVHSSRVIRFDGVEIPERAFINNNYWGDSVLLSSYSNLRNFNSAHSATAAILQDFNQTVFELENLADLLASGDDALIQKRLSLIDATRSVVRAIVIQKGEGFRRDTANLSGLSDTVRLLSNRLVASSNMPHTLILGEGSQGNTSGRSEEIDFYNLVAQKQQTYLLPLQMKLLELLCAAADGPGINFEDVSISYKPLWEMDALESAQIYKTNAEADAIYITNGVVDPEEVAKSRFSDPEAELTVDLELRESLSNTEALEGNTGEIPNSSPDSTIQDMALNGAQVTSLLEIINGVTSGSIPPASASAIISAAFPAISRETIDRILNPLRVTPPAPEVGNGNAG